MRTNTIATITLLFKITPPQRSAHSKRGAANPDQNQIFNFAVATDRKERGTFASSESAANIIVATEASSHEPRSVGTQEEETSVSDKVHLGKCFCGAVEIRVTGEPAAMGYCHCTSCRQWS